LIIFKVKVSTEDLQPTDRSDVEVISRYRPRVDALVDEVPEYADVRETFHEFVAAVDSRGVENLDSIEPSKFPNVRIPVTHIDVDEIASDLTDKPVDEATIQDNENIGSRPEVTTVVFPAWESAGRGHPFEFWGQVYNETTKGLAKLDARKSKIISFGCPHSTIGEVTQEWVDGIKREGFDLYGESYAEYLAQEIPMYAPEDNQVPPKVKFIGFSLGCHVASVTIDHLIRLRPDLEPLIDSNDLIAQFFLPVGHHNLASLDGLSDAVQVPIGFASEIAGRFVLSPDGRTEELTDEPAFQKQLHQRLGITDEELKRKKPLAKKAATYEALHLVAGLTYPDIASRVKTTKLEGIYDSTTKLNPIDILRLGMKKAKHKLTGSPKPINYNFNIAPSDSASKTKTFRMDTSHYIDQQARRLPRWIQRLRSFQNKYAQA
jgi:hypothetical protein